MQKTLGIYRAMLMIFPLLAIGCGDSPDERLAELAERSLRQQADQNARLAERTKDLTNTARHLIENDSQARKQLIEAHATLQQEIQSERANINQQLSNLEQERRDIAQQRHRDPIIANALSTLGTTLACLAPLALAAYLVYSVNRPDAESAALNELLVTEIAADEPKLLSMVPPSVTAIEHRSSSGESGDQASGE